MARTDSLWKTIQGGTAIQTIAPAGYDILINGTSKYLNFNTIVGSSGYGIRDNAGVMEVKNSGGTWGAVISPYYASGFLQNTIGITGGTTLIGGTAVTNFKNITLNNASNDFAIVRQ